MPIAQLASRLTTRAWLIVGGGAVAAILFVYIFLHLVSQPGYSTLMSGLDPSQTGKMTSTLSEHGVSYQLQNNGTALAVQSNQTAEARVALAGAGLLGNSQPGFSLFEKQKLGESNFQQEVTYQRALQGQLDETINSVQGVSGAQVELVLPSSTSQAFGESQSASSAAVLLSGTTSLDPGSVRGIAQLVASSVRGLQLSKVTITDASGQLLWPQASGSSGGSGTSVQEAEQRYDQTTAASLDAMLAQTRRAGQGAGARLRQHERRPDDQGIARIRQEGRTPAAEQIARDARRQRHGGRRHGHRQPPRRDPERRQVQLQARNDRLLAGRLQDRHPLHDRSRRGRKPARLGAARPLRSRRLDARRSRKRSPTPPASRPSAATRSRSARSPSPRRPPPPRPPPPARSPTPSTRCSGWAPRCSSSSAPARCASARRASIEEPVWLRELEAPMRLSELERENAPLSR